MCLAIPGRITCLETRDGVRRGLVDLAGVQIDACMDLTPEARVGDYVIVHAGCSLQILDEDEAAATLAILSELARIDEPDGGSPP